MPRPVRFSKAKEIPGLVSVLVPVYNGEKFLLSTVGSILHQDYPTIEVIAVDDGSEDRSWRILRSIRDTRLRLVRHPRNLGIPHARNTGLKKARGRWVTFCDQDDLLTPGSLSARIRFLHHHPEAGSVFGRITYVRRIRGRLRRVFRPLEACLYPFYRKIGRIPLPILCRYVSFPGALTTHLIRRELIEQVGDLNPSWKMVDDWEYAIRLAQICEPYFIDKVVLWHRFHDKNTAIRFSLGKLQIDPVIQEEAQALCRTFPDSLSA